MTDIGDARYKNFQHYIDEGWSKEPKKTFQHVRQAIATLGLERARALDIGCATGELVDYLSHELPQWSFVGIDLFEPLIEEARRLVPSAEFLKQDLLSLDASLDGTFDVVLAVGVISLFEDKDAERFWDKVHALLRPGGTVIVLGPLNEFGIDMNLRHRKWIDGVRGDWERGWSIPSRQSVEQEVASRFQRYEITPYPPGLDLEPKNDPIRTWTVPYAGKARQLTNGLKLLVDYYLIVAHR